MFWDITNGKDPKLKLSNGHKADSKLNFLDYNVNGNIIKFVTSFYRKPTFSSLGISYFPFCAFRFTVGGCL